MASPSDQNSLCADKLSRGVMLARQDTINDASVAHVLIDFASDFSEALETELNGFANALGIKINAILDILQEHGLVLDADNNLGNGRYLLQDKSNNGVLRDTQSDNVADAVTNHDIADVGTELDAASETELQGFLNALGTKINLILTNLKAHGIMATGTLSKQDSLYCDKNGNPMLTTRQANIADAVTSHTIVDADDDDIADALEAEIEAQYDALGESINECLDVLEANGLMIAT